MSEPNHALNICASYLVEVCRHSNDIGIRPNIWDFVARARRHGHNDVADAIVRELSFYLDTLRRGFAEAIMDNDEATASMGQEEAA